MLPPQLSGGVTLTGLHWHGRTFDIRIGATSTTVTLRSGSSFPVETPAGTQTLSGSLTLPTRRPDLTPTDNVARCRPATATSEEAGMYAEAAVDGSDATIWAPVDAAASLTVELGKLTKVSDVQVHWTETLPSSSRIEWSTDGTTWTTVGHATVRARYVRVTMTRAAGADRTGIREVVVTG
jgi:F5/8 type C domain-containing protein/glycosyl hydrolase family 65